jgi:cytochrome c553
VWLRVTLAAVLVAAAFSLPAIARDPARGGEIAAERCVACHGMDGRSSLAEIPRLAGQQSGFITLQMILFREGIRQVPAMQSPTEKLSDTDIEAVAAYYAGLPSAAPEDRTGDFGGAQLRCLPFAELRRARANATAYPSA